MEEEREYIIMQANGDDLLLCANQQEGRAYGMFDAKQRITPSQVHALRGRKVRVLWVTELAWSAAASEMIATARRRNPDMLVRRVSEWKPGTMTALEYKHEPMEATGGYIECECGWPTRDQYKSHEPYIRHVIEEYENGVDADV